MVLKIIMIGDSGVGKSCVLKAFMGDPYQPGYTSTIGVDFEIKPVVLEGKTVNLQIWDTAGQERFRTITTSYYRSSDTILMVYDVTDQNTFKNLDSWLEDVRLYARKNVLIILLGNKVDLPDEREVDFKVAEEFAQRNGMEYVEVSAKEGVNVQEAFKKITAIAVTKIRAQKATAAALPTAESVKLSGGQRPDTWCSC